MQPEHKLKTHITNLLSRWRQTSYEAVGYWEKRRILFNSLMLPSAWVIYVLRTGVSSGVGDTKYMQDYQVYGLFAIALVCANICYSCVYALEFLIGSHNPKSLWMRFGRRSVFVVGCIVGVIFATLVAQSIGADEYSPP